MKLSKLLEGFPEIEIDGISLDSRNVKKGDLFFAITGNIKKGSEFIEGAIKNGAVAIIGDETLGNVAIPYFKVDNIRQKVALVASRFYSKKPQHLLAITGTNGKTSIADFVSQIFKILGHKSSSIGTMGVVSDDYNFDFGTTTPSAIDMHKTLETLANQGVDSVIFEASSHGIEQYRVEYIKVQTAGFTNLTQDHLDYHKTMDNYKSAKKRLFTEILPQDKIAVINADDPYFEYFADCGKKVWSYGKNGKEIRLISNQYPNLEIELFDKKYQTKTNIIGDFQIMNILCAVGMCIACGLDAQKVINTIPNLKTPVGRLDFAGELENGAKIYIDYAHTPDALEKALEALRPYTNAKLSVVFGCGGDRDKTKRPIMGSIADKLADRVYVSDDNPRTEDANTIRKEVLQNCSGKCIDVQGRDIAIKIAMQELEKNDILLIAGKGHEDYQIIGTTKHHFNDKEEVIKNIKGK